MPAPSSGSGITQEDTGSSASYSFSIALNGSIRTNYDIYQSSPNYNQTTMLFTLSGSSLLVTNTGNTSTTVNRISIYVGSNTYRVYTFSASLSAGQKIYISNVDNATTGTIQNSSGTSLSTFSITTTTSNTITFSSETSYAVNVIVNYNYGVSAIDWTTVKVATVYAYDKVLSGIYISTAPSNVSFYKNSAMSLSGLAVKTRYKLYVANTTLSNVGSTITSSCSFTYPSGTILTESGTNVISYGGFSISYDFTVVRAVNHTNVLASYYKLGQTISGLTTTITYSNGATSTNVSVSLSGYNKDIGGNQTVICSATAPNTNEVLSWEEYITVVVPTLKIYTSGGTNHYAYLDTTIVKTGMLVKLDYNQAGETTLNNSDVTFAWVGTRTQSSRQQTISVSYGSYITTYDVYIDGIDSIVPTSLANIQNRYLIGTSQLSINTEVTVTLYTNGVSSTSTGNAIVTQDSRTTIGNKNITWTYTVAGVTKTYVKTYYAYTYTSLRVENPTTEVYSSDPYLRFNTDTFKVYGVANDGLGEDLLVLNTDFTISPAKDSPVSSSGSYTITTKDKIDTVSRTFNFTYSQLAPAVGATYLLTGINQGHYYGNGIIFDRGSIVVSEMNDGQTEYSLYDNFETIPVKNGVEYPNRNPSDSGAYEIKLKVNGSEVNYFYYANGIKKNSSNDGKITVYRDGISSVSISKIKRSNYPDNKMRAGWSLQRSDIVAYKYLDSDPTVPVLVDDTDTITFSEQTFSYSNQTQTVTATICGIQATKEVTVISPNQVLGASPLQTKIYNYGDTIDFSNYIFSVNFDDADFPSEVITTGVTCNRQSLVPDSIMNSANCSIYFSYTDISGKPLTSSSSYIQVYAIKKLSILQGSTTKSEKPAQGAEVIGKAYFNKNATNDFTGWTVKTEYTIGPTNTENLTTLIDTINLVGIINDGVAHNGAISKTVGTQTLTAHLVVHSRAVKQTFKSVSWGINNSYYVDDTIYFTNFTAVAEWQSTDENDTDIPSDISITLNDSNLSILYASTNYKTGFVCNQANNNLIFTANYNHSTNTVSGTSSAVTVNAVVFSRMELEVTSSWKTTYVVGQNLDLNGLTVKIYRNNSETPSTMSASSNNFKISYLSAVDTYTAFEPKSHVFTNADVTNLTGKQLFVEYYEENVFKARAQIGQTALTVVAKTLVSIDAVGQKTDYHLGEQFTTNGMTVYGTYNDNDRSPITEGWTVSGVTVGHTFVETDVVTYGQVINTIKVSYNGLEYVLGVKILTPIVTELSLGTSSMLGTYTNGVSTWDISSLTVTCVYSKGYTKTLTNAQYTVTLPNTMHVDSQTNVVYGSGTGSAPFSYETRQINVSATDPLSSTSVSNTFNISILQNSTPTNALFQPNSSDYLEYLVGDEFDAHGIAYLLQYSDGSTTTTTNGIIYSISTGTQFRSAGKIDLTFYYSYAGNKIAGSEMTIKLNVALPNVATTSDLQDYAIVVGESDGSLITQVLDPDGNVIKIGKQYEGNVLVSEYYPLVNKNFVNVDNVSSHACYGFNRYIGQSLIIDCAGYMDMGITALDGSVTKPAHVVLFADPINPIDGDGNIEVTFPHYISGYSDKINKAKFGIVYHNSLFLSGNPSIQNCDWHSADSDFTYFSDLDYCRYGTDDTAIVGYDIYSDGDLIVAKEGSREQATLYRREYKLIEAVDSTGAVIEGSYEPSFPMFDINLNGGLGGKSMTNFVGQSLILTKEGIKAISSKEDIYNNAKYTVDVSSYINPMIKKEEIEFMYSFKEELILKTSRGIYIGYNRLRNEDNEYEWFFITGINADLFFEHNGTLYYANDKGEIYFLPELDLQDKTRVFVGDGGATLTINEQLNTITASSSYDADIEEGKTFHLITKVNDVTSQAHANLGLFINENARTSEADKTIFAGTISNTTITIDPINSDGTVNFDEFVRLNKLFYDGRKVYIDQITSDTDISARITHDREYTLKKIGENSYSLVNSDNQIVSLIGLKQARFSFIINDLAITHITQVTPVVGGGKMFKLLGDHDLILDLIYYNNRSSATYSGIITTEHNIEAFYLTSPYVMESLVRTKTIWSWVIANDTALASQMDVGYISSVKQNTYDMAIESSKGARQLDFGNVSFSKVQFTTDKLPHIYTRYKTLPNVNFIRFVFKNYEESNIVLTTLQLVYTYSQFTKGVK